MSDVPNRPEDPPPATLGESSTPIYTVPDDASCAACDLPVRAGQSPVVTDLGYILHSYCWEKTR